MSFPTPPLSRPDVGEGVARPCALLGFGEGLLWMWWRPGGSRQLRWTGRNHPWFAPPLHKPLATPSRAETAFWTRRMANRAQAEGTGQGVVGWRWQCVITGGLVAVAALGSAQGKGLEFLCSLLQTEGVLAPQLTQQSSGRSGGGTVFGPTPARQVLVSASYVRGSP